MRTRAVNTGVARAGWCSVSPFPENNRSVDVERSNE
jgi:hypothetical protein